ncbi:hypothetical protein [Streptosporangium vulgare]|uniref:hypothetical protein n=1 Tax=Streptosporangium vulgare TaxID=46190 RepID=UPI0031DCE697
MRSPPARPIWPTVMPTMESANMPLATYMIGFPPPPPANISPIAAPPATIGRYMSTCVNPAEVVSGISGGDSRRISPRGGAGGGRRSGRRTTTMPTSPPM